MATYTIHTRNGQYVGLATNRPDFGCLAGSPIAGALPEIDKSLTAMEDFNKSPRGKALERTLSALLIMVICFIIVVFTWFMPLFTRTLIHPSVIKSYRFNSLISFAVGLSGLFISIVTLLFGWWHLGDSLDPWTLACLDLISLSITAFAFSYVQDIVANLFPHYALNSGTGWLGFIPTFFKSTLGWGWGLLQDALIWITCFLFLSLESGYQVDGPLIESLLIVAPVFIPTWIAVEYYKLKVVPVDESGFLNPSPVATMRNSFSN